jgi:hypothetical protein
VIAPEEIGGIEFGFKHHQSGIIDPKPSRTRRPSAPRPRSRASGLPLLSSGYVNSAGLRVAPSRSSIVGQKAVTIATQKTRPSSLAPNRAPPSKKTAKSKDDPRQSRPHNRPRKGSGRQKQAKIFPVVSARSLADGCVGFLARGMVIG